MKKQSNTPKIRFHNYKELWECDDLKNIFGTIRNAFVGTATPYYVEKGHFYLESNNVKNGKINYNSQIFINDEFYEKQRDKWLKTNDIVMVQSGHVGHTAVIPKELNNTAAHALIVFTDYKKEVNPHFLNYQFQSSSKRKKLDLISTGNTIKHILASEMKSFKMDFPTVEEQSAIGSLFRTLDDLLTSYKDNLANYQSLKTTMLSKMFPKAGRTVPEIRLDGFEGEWEVVNLGTLIENYDEVISGTSGFPIATSSRKGLYLQNDYFEGGRTGIDLTLDFHRVPIGYVTYRHMSDDSIFKFNKNNFETDVLVSKEYPVFISNDSSDIDFLLYHLNNSRLFLRFSTMQKLGGTRVRLYYKNLITYKIAVPTVKEQQAIGAYFSILDNLIATHQEKISQLETLKKKLLQDMFI
ncbi:restriction endonuclease subunit S [Streptococcus vestibularis]|uniref:Type I restriction modification DNA specificity domain protein n=1 Tax=Streptococcus vestibularis F0396 TaxID=904306 RepID=E3CPW9_STRVE|nr:type I restriction modification DNA specificity domain protein [Streptococcus vestibularis F0396]MBT3132554.1 restriction endonuclease subunit S [Streptococcus vestibularis]